LRHLTIGRALLGILVLTLVACVPAGCSRRDAPKTPAAESRPASQGLSDPNAENPDRDTWVDLATKPFEPKLVGGHLVQLRGMRLRSLNAVIRADGSPDVERIHKYHLGAPLLMEAPDLGPRGVEVLLHAAAKMPEDSADHLTQVWTLRPDLTWEDGKPVTAADYAFTFKMIRNPDVDSNVREHYAAVASLEAIDTHRFKVTWKSPQRAAIEKIGVDFQVVPEHAVPHDAASFNKTPTHLACGPYRAAAFEPGKRVEMVLRDEYRTKPFPIRPNYVERLSFESTGDPIALLTRLVNREAHVVLLSGDQYATQGTEPSFRAAAWRTAFAMPSYSFIAWNLKDPADLSKPHPVLGDVRVRRALSHLVALQTIAETTYRGLARPVSGPFDYRDLGYDPAIAHVAYDPPKAAALLREAGWAPGPDGRLAKDGRPCRITLARTNQTAPLNITVAPAFQEEARRSGVTVDLVQPAKFFDDLGAHRFDAALVLWQLDLIEPDVSREFHSRYAASGGYNYSGLADPAVDREIDAHEASFDRAARVGIRRQIHRLVHDAAPVAFLLINEAPVGISRTFANVKVHDYGLRYHDFVLRELWEKHRPR
jgi:peptide/nickel transport system substrate-binding protein